MTAMKTSGSRRLNTLPSELLPPEDFSMELPSPEKLQVLLPTFDSQDPTAAARSGGGHFRSLSAPDKASSASSWDFSPRSSLNQSLKESLMNWRWKAKSKGPEDRKKTDANDRRAALENDVAQLQTRLQDEKAVREGLERALGVASGAPPPQGVLSNLAPQTRELITEIASLEKEVTHLEQHVLSLYRKVLDQRRPGGRAPPPGLSHSEPSSPCRLSEAKHASFLYRESRLRTERIKHDVEEPCRPPHSPSSPQHRCRVLAAHSQGGKRPHSPVAADRPARTRPGSLLGGTFCAIDEEPREDQALPTAFLSIDQRTTKFSSPRRSLSALDSMKSLSSIQETSIPEHSTRIAPLRPSNAASETYEDDDGDEDESREDVADEASARNPNKLSEELVRCMAAIYCKLADPPLLQLTPPMSPSSSSSGSSSEAAASPRCELSNESWSPRWRTDSNNACEMSGAAGPLTDPYAVKSSDREGAGAYSSMVEVPWICVDKDRLTYAARALRNFRSMVEQLEQVDPGQMSHDQKLAFWINIYNALMMHAYLAYGIPRNKLKRLSLLQKAAYKVGPHSINAQTIEHCILRCRSNRPAQWLQSLLSPGTKFKAGDERRAYALDTPEPLVCFALCCGGRSDPAIRAYSATNVRSELECAKREFFQASVGIRSENKVLLPRILEWYARELVINYATLLELVCQNVPDKLQSHIMQCIQMKPHKSSSHCLEWQPYSFGFRYIFVQDLAHRFPASAQ